MASVGDVDIPVTARELLRTPALEQLEELPLIEHRHVQLPRPCQLRARIASGNQIAGFLRDAARNLRTPRLEGLLRLLAGHRLERPSDDEGAPRERLAAARARCHLRPRHTLFT